MGEAKLACFATARHGEGVADVDLRQVRVSNLLSVAEFALQSTSGISKWVYRHASQEVCPWNVKFARSLPTDSPFAPRAAIAGKDARALAEELLVMTLEQFSTTFKGSPMKRAKLSGLSRNATIALDNIARGRASTSPTADAGDDRA